MTILGLGFAVTVRSVSISAVSSFLGVIITLARLRLIILGLLLLLFLTLTMLLIGIQDTIVVFGELVECFSRDVLPGRCGIAREREILVENLLRCTANLPLGTVAIERLVPR